MANWIARVLNRTLNDNHIQVLDRIKETMVLTKLPNKPDEASLKAMIPDNFDFGYIRMHKEGIIVTPHGILACLYPEAGREDIYFHQTIGNERPANQRHLVTTIPSRAFKLTKMEDDRDYHRYMKRLGIVLGNQFYFDDIDSDVKHRPYEVSCLRLNTKRLSAMQKNRLMTLIAANNDNEIVTLYTDGKSTNDYGDEVGLLLDIASRKGGNTGTLRCFGLNPETLEFSKDWYEVERDNTNPIFMNVAFGMMLETNTIATFKSERWPDDIPRPPYTEFAINYWKEELSNKIREAGINTIEDRWKYFFTETVGENGELHYQIIPGRIPMKTRAEWEAWEQEQATDPNPFVYVGLKIPVKVNSNEYIAPTYAHIPMYELKNAYSKRTKGLKFFPLIPFNNKNGNAARYSFEHSDNIDDILNYRYRHGIGKKTASRAYLGTAFANDAYGLATWFREECIELSQEIKQFIRELYFACGGVKEIDSTDGLTWRNQAGEVVLDLSQLDVIYCISQQEVQDYFVNLDEVPGTPNAGGGYRVNGSENEIYKQWPAELGITNYEGHVRFILFAMCHTKVSLRYRCMSGTKNTGIASMLKIDRAYSMTKNRGHMEAGFSEVILQHDRSGIYLNTAMYRREQGWHTDQNILQPPTTDRTAQAGIATGDGWTKNLYQYGFVSNPRGQVVQDYPAINAEFMIGRSFSVESLNVIATNAARYILNNAHMSNLYASPDVTNGFFYLNIPPSVMPEIIQAYKNPMKEYYPVASYNNGDVILPMHRVVSYSTLRPKFDSKSTGDDVMPSIGFGWRINEYNRLNTSHESDYSLLNIDRELRDAKITLHETWNYHDDSGYDLRPAMRWTNLLDVGAGWFTDVSENGGELTFLSLNPPQRTSTDITLPEDNTIAEYVTMMKQYGVNPVQTAISNKLTYNRTYSYKSFFLLYRLARFVKALYTYYLEDDYSRNFAILRIYESAGIIDNNKLNKLLYNRSKFLSFNIDAHFIMWIRDLFMIPDNLENAHPRDLPQVDLDYKNDKTIPHSINEVFKQLNNFLHYGELQITDDEYGFSTFRDWLSLNKERIKPAKSKYAIDWEKFKIKNPMFITELESPNVNAVCNYTVKETFRRCVDNERSSVDMFIFNNWQYNLEEEDWKEEYVIGGYASFTSGVSPYVEMDKFTMGPTSVFHVHDAAKIDLWKNNIELAKMNVTEGGEIFHAQYFALYPVPMSTNTNSEYYLFPYVADFFPVNPPKEVVEEFFMTHVYNNGVEAFYKKYPPNSDSADRMIEFLRGLGNEAYKIVMKHYDNPTFNGSPLHDILKQHPNHPFTQMTFWYSMMDYVHFDMILSRVINYINQREKPYIQRALLDDMKQVFVPDADDPDNTKLVTRLLNNDLSHYILLAIDSVEHACSPYSDKSLIPSQRNIAYRKIRRSEDHPANISLQTTNPYIATRQHLYRPIVRIFAREWYDSYSPDRNGIVLFNLQSHFLFLNDNWIKDWLTNNDISHMSLSRVLLRNYDRYLGRRTGLTEARIHHYFGNSDNHIQIGIISEEEYNALFEHYPSRENKFTRNDDIGGVYGDHYLLSDSYYVYQFTPPVEEYKSNHRTIRYRQDDSTIESYRPLMLEMDYQNGYKASMVNLAFRFNPNICILGQISDQTEFNKFVASLNESSPLFYLKHLDMKPHDQMDYRTYVWIHDRLYSVMSALGDRYPNYLSPEMYKYYREALGDMVVSIPKNYEAAVRNFISKLRDIRHYRTVMLLLAILPWNQIDSPELLMTAVDETVDFDRLDCFDSFVDKISDYDNTPDEYNKDPAMFYHATRAIKYLRGHLKGGGENNIIRNESLIEIVRGNNIVRFDRTVFRKGGSSNLSKDVIVRGGVKASNVRGIRLFSPRITNEEEITKLTITTYPTNRVVQEMRVGKVNFGSIRMRDKLSHSSWYIVVSDRPSELVIPSGMQTDRKKLVSIMKIGGSPTLTDSYILQGTWLKTGQTSITLRQFHDEYVTNPDTDNVPDNILPENAVAYYAVSPTGQYLEFPERAEYQTVIEEDGKPVIARFRSLDNGPTDVASCFIIVAVNE